MVQLSTGTWVRFAVWMAVGRCPRGECGAPSLAGISFLRLLSVGGLGRLFPPMCLIAGTFAGFLIYFGYGIRNSVEGKNAKELRSSRTENPLHHPGMELSPGAAAV